MTLKDIISISGKSGLHKIVGRRPTGLIVEAMDETKARIPVSYNQKISVLDDIAIYTQTGEARLLQVFVNILELGNVPDPKSDNEVLKDYFAKALPEYDAERVYISDIKKVLNWYTFLQPQLDFKALLEEHKKEAEAGEEEGSEAKAELEKKAFEAKHPKAVSVQKAGKTNSKSAGGSKTTYRPKSV